jgi:uncharacterized protein (TIGR00725 family)
MRIKVGVMGSASELSQLAQPEIVRQQALDLAAAIVDQDVVLLTGATTGLVCLVGKAVKDTGGIHIGISPASSEVEHVERYHLPTDACTLLIYTGFGLKGRNVVLVRSCDIVLFINGSMGSLNEFTIAHDEGKIIGCLVGSGGVADQSNYLLSEFGKNTGAKVIQNPDPHGLLRECRALLPERG